MNDLNITLIQTNIHWLDIATNLKSYEIKMDPVAGKTDLVVLPEMFTTGFTMDPSAIAEKMEGHSMSWMAEQANKMEAVIAGSLVIEENGEFFNRFIWMYPGGMYHAYDKRHLFTMAGEDERYTPGDERLIISYNGWQICPQICYDLRFPVWSRNDNSFDLLLYVANWPDKRSYDWKTLLRARAIENQAYVIGVNRIGEDPNGHVYSGDSCVIDPGWERTIFDFSDRDGVHTVSISKDHLNNVRTKLPFLADKDEFAIL